MGNVASTAKMAGIGMNEMLASLSAMTLGGISTDEAVTALNAVILGLAKPQDDAKKSMEKMGITYGIAGIKAKGLQAIFKQIADAQKKHGEDAVFGAIKERRALKAIAALVGGGKLGKISEILAKINSDLKTGDGLMRAFADMNSSMSMKYKRAMGQMTVALKGFVVLMAPAINAILEGVAGMAKYMSKLPKPLKIIIVGMLALLAVVGPIVAVLGGLAFALSSIIAILPVVAVGLIAVGLGVNSIVWPVLLAVTAFTAWSLAIQSVVANLDTLKAPDLLKDLWDWSNNPDRDPNAGIVPAEEGAESAAVLKSQSRIAAKTAAGKMTMDGELRIKTDPGTTVDTSYMNVNAGNNIPMVQQ
jgi:hypothetical protein